MVGITDSPTRARVIDLRGLRAPSSPAPVLADPSGRRARRLRVAGRILGSLFLLWLCGLVLAGLGLLPVSDIPLAGTLRAAEEPTQVSGAPSSRGTPSADFQLAQPLSEVRDAVAGATRTAGRAPTTRAGTAQAHAGARGSGAGAGHRDSRTARDGHSGASGGSHTARHPSGSTGATRGGSSAPAATSSAHGNGNAYGRGGTTAPSSGSGAVHGQSASPHGSAATAPGHTRTTTAHGPPAG